MKKALALVLLCMLCGTAFVFADDASVLPARVGRVYLAPVFAFADGQFDANRDYVKYRSGEGATKVFALGVAAEYGVLDWISAAVQWTPAWVIASDVDVKQKIPIGTYKDTVMDDVNANGPADVFVGGKFLLVGDKAPFQSSQVRIALATGVKIPLPGPDFEEQLKNGGTGKAVTAANQDKHVVGLGLRTYADYVFNEHFYLDFYTEFIGYPAKGKLSESGLTGYIQWAGLNQMIADNPIPPNLYHFEDEVFYGYDLTLELEPVFSTSLSRGVNFTAGLPLNFHFSPPNKYDVFLHPMITGMNPDAAALVPEGSASLLLSLRPSVSFFFTNFVLPTEFKLGYWAPIAGESSLATHYVTLQIKVYFKL
jgi:hypothetical protein